MTTVTSTGSQIVERSKTVTTKRSSGKTKVEVTDYPPETYLSRYDTRDRFGSPLKKLSSGKTFRRPNAYLRRGHTLEHKSGVYSKVVTNGTSSISTVEKDRHRGALNRSVPSFVDQNGTFLLDQNQENQCIMKALQALADGKAELGTFGAESLHAYERLAGRSIQFYNIILAMKRGRWSYAAHLLGYNRGVGVRGHAKRGIKHSVKNWSSFWLEYQYGIKPLFNDIHSLYEVARLYGARPYELVTARASVLEAGTSVELTSTSKCFNKAQRRYTSSIVGKLYSEQLRFASQIGMVNPASVAWELVPFSFVVDWGLPVGQFLEALSAPCGLTFHSGSLSRLSKLECQSEEIPPSDWTVLSERRMIEKSYYFRRTLLGGFPTPRLYARNPFNTTRVVTAAALHQQLRR